MSFNSDLDALLEQVLSGGTATMPDEPATKPALSQREAAIAAANPTELTLADILASEGSDDPEPISDDGEEPACGPEPNESRSDGGTTPTADSATPAASGSTLDTRGTTSSNGTEGVTRRVNEELEADIEAAAVPALDESAWSVAEPTQSVPMPEFTSDELMEELDIRNYGMLVALNTQRWHAKTRDHKAALDAALATGADPKAFESRKRLLVGADEKLKAVHTAIDAARTDHYRMTLPWSTVGVNDFGKRAGPRLLPNTLFFDYTQKMGQHKVAMDAALNEFVQAYPTLIAIAQQKLGGSFVPADYPAPSAIQKHFDLSFDFLPIPVGADFDSVQVQQVEKLSAALNRKTRAMLENAMQDAWQRLHKDISHAYTALSTPESKFHYTLIDKMREHASMLVHLNVTKDPRIESIRDQIDQGLCRWDVKEIRKDDALRRRMAEAAKGILNTMQEVTDERGS